MYSFTFENNRKVLDLVRALAEFYGGVEYATEGVLLVKTEDKRLECSLRALVESLDVKTAVGRSELLSGVEVGAVVVPPSRARKHFEARVCEACGRSYLPSRKDQRFCPAPDCKKGRGKLAAVVVSAPVVEEVKDDLPFEQTGK